MPHPAAQIIIPDDFPPVISGTPALQTMQAHGNVTVYTSRPETQDELVGPSTRRILSSISVPIVNSPPRSCRRVRTCNIWPSGAPAPTMWI